jgi:hypothetical protein
MSELKKKYDLEKSTPPSLNLPDLSIRNKFLTSIELPSTWDELSIDIFYMDLKSKKITELEKKYPHLNKENLIKLMSKIE